ncbi:MAG: transposase [Candidatus Woesebacteria bacterium]
MRRRARKVSSRLLAKLHLSGVSYRTLGDMYEVNASTVCRRVNAYLKRLPANADVTRLYCTRFCGMLVLDGKCINIRGYKTKASLIWGVDYLTHDVPHFRLAPFESYQASFAYFQSLRLLNYPLQMLICDDNVSFKLAVMKVYPKTVIQTCTNHFKENIRKNLKTRSNDTYKEFMKEIEYIFSRKRSDQEYQGLAKKVYSKWQYDPVTRSVLLDMAKRQQELLAYTKVASSPQTTNLIEAYNSHLQARLKSLKSFNDYSHAKNWLNGYILKRRITPLKACRGKFRKLNGKPPLSYTLQDNKELPCYF